MRALALYLAHEAQRSTPSAPPSHRPQVDVEKVARRIVTACVTALVLLCLAVALPMPTGG